MLKVRAMLITTSRRPGRLSRTLCRELAFVIPGSFYFPRGSKTIEEVTAAAHEFEQKKILLVESASGRPRELRFLEVDQGWRWLDAVVEIGDVRVRNPRLKSQLTSLKIHAVTAASFEFAKWIDDFLGLGVSDEPPTSGGVALIASENGLRIKFKVMPNSEMVGPSLLVTAFGGLSAATSRKGAG